MKNWIVQNKLYFIDAFAEFLYCKYVGCLTDLCRITSDPTHSSVYFAVIGGLVFGMFKKESKKITAIITK